ncbi:MAG: M2 family metallopeptidase [Candidatus Micrarchaeota archaeon]
MKNFSMVLFAFVLIFCAGCLQQSPIVKTPIQNQTNTTAVQVQTVSADDELRGFLFELETNLAQLEKENNLAYFTASISGKEEDYEMLSEKTIALAKAYSNKSDFAKLSAFMESGNITDLLLKRELEVLYNSYLSSQVDEKKIEAIINLQNTVEQEFNTYRVQLDGNSITDNEVEEILTYSNDSEELKAVWLNSKEIGPVVSDKVIQLVKMRNEVAHELGFNNYHEMSLILNEQSPADVTALFDELDILTRDKYAQMKDELDDSLSQRYGVPKDELMPWHYQNRFFQSVPPSVYAIDFDSYYSDKDAVKITEDYYMSMGLPIDDVIIRSDLYEKPGKYQHAYASYLDRSQDVRIVANVKPGAYWMDTMLHESGHAAYFKYINSSLPWALRSVDISTTEGVAMMFQEMAYKPEWIKSAVNISMDEGMRINSTRYMQADALIFSSWAQVMYRFEKSMYENPDQDLNKLWWDLVEKYQLLKKPEGRDEPDWASKIHIATVPAYYHNYMIGWLIDSQLQHTLSYDVLGNDGDSSKSFYGQKEVGEYLKENLFRYGIQYKWDETIVKATGENLTAKYFAEDVGVQVQ